MSGNFQKSACLLPFMNQMRKLLHAGKVKPISLQTESCVLATSPISGKWEKPAHVDHVPRFIMIPEILLLKKRLFQTLLPVLMEKMHGIANCGIWFLSSIIVKKMDLFHLFRISMLIQVWVLNVSFRLFREWNQITIPIFFSLLFVSLNLNAKKNIVSVKRVRLSG